MTKKLDRRSKYGRGGRPGSSSGDGDGSLTLIDNSGEVMHIARRRDRQAPLHVRPDSHAGWRRVP